RRSRRRFGRDHADCRGVPEMSLSATSAASGLPQPWLAGDLEADRSWRRTLSAHCVDQLRRAVDHAKQTGKTFLQMRAPDFPLDARAAAEVRAAFMQTQQRW